MFISVVLLQRARKMGLKKANGLDYWSVSLLNPLPATFCDALAKRVERGANRVADVFTSLVFKAEGGSDPLKVKP